MPSLAYCLKRFNISDTEFRMLRDNAKKYMKKEGMTQGEAETTAVRDWIKTIEADRADVMGQIKAIVDDARAKHKDPWFSFNWAVKHLPEMRGRIQNLVRMFNDSKAFANGDIYDGSYPIPKRGGIMAARASKRYAEDAEYAARVEGAIEDIKANLRDTVYTYQIITGQPRTGVFGVDYNIDWVEDPDKEVGRMTAPVVAAWNHMATKQYGRSYALGGVSIREALQNSSDAVATALAEKKIKKGLIEINVFSDDQATILYDPDATVVYSQGFEVIDNGIGMDDTTLKDKFLALFQSGKNNELAEGGFGIAKAVILCPTSDAKWEIETRDNYFNSEQCEREEKIKRLVKARQGTRIKVTSKSDNFVRGDGRKYIITSEFPKTTTVKYNGKVLKNPFFRKRGKKFTYELHKDTDTPTRYEATFYRNAPDGYDNSIIYRLVNEKTGVKLTQAINTAAGSGFTGCIVCDIYTKAKPNHKLYPLDSSRMHLNEGADQPIKDIIKKYTVDTLSGDQDVESRWYSLPYRSEWKNTIDKAATDKGYQEIVEAVQKEWNEHVVPDWARRGKDIVQNDFNDLRQGYSPFTPLQSMEVEIDKGYKGYKGGSMMHAKFIAIFEAMARMSAPYANATTVGNFRLLLSTPNASGGSTEARFNGGTGALWFNHVMLDKTAMKHPLALADYMKGLIDHELTHSFVGPHDEKFASLREETQMRTSALKPVYVRLAEKFLNMRDAEMMREKEKIVTKERVVKVEVDKIIEKFIPKEQRELWDNPELETNYGQVELYRPIRQADERQLGLFGRRVVGFSPGWSGEDATAEPGGRAKQPGASGDVAVEQGRGEPGAAIRGEAEEVKKYGFSMYDAIARIEPQFEQGRYVDLKNLFEQGQKENWGLTKKAFTGWLEKLAFTGRFQKGVPSIFLVEAPAIPGKETFKIGDKNYIMAGSRKVFSQTNAQIADRLENPMIGRRVSLLPERRRTELVSELGVRAVFSPAFKGKLQKALASAESAVFIAERDKNVEAQLNANTLYGLYTDALAFVEAYNGVDNHMLGAVQDWLDGTTYISDIETNRVFTPEQYQATRAAKEEKQATYLRDMGVTLKDVRDLFKGQKVMINPDGDVAVRTVGGEGLVIKAVDEISPDQVSFSLGYGRMKSDGMLVSGRYQDGVIELHKDLSGRWTLNHETYHWLEDVGFVTARESEILSNHIRKLTDQGNWKPSNKDDPGNFEDRANYIAWMMEARRQEPSPIRRFLNKIADFIDSLVNLFKTTARGIVREIETGRMFSRDVKATQAEGVPRYEQTAPVFYSQMENTVRQKLQNKGTINQFEQWFDTMAGPPTALTEEISTLEKKANAGTITDAEQTRLKAVRKQAGKYKNQFKRDELEWSGLSDWFNGLRESGVKIVTKKDVMDWLEANNMKTRDILLGEDGVDESEMEEDVEYEDLEWSTYPEYVEPDDAYAESEIDYFYEEYTKQEIADKYDVDDPDNLTPEQEEEARELAEQQFYDYDAENGRYAYNDSKMGYTIYENIGAGYFELYEPNGRFMDEFHNLYEAQRAAWTHALDYHAEEMMVRPEATGLETKFGSAEWQEEGGVEYRELLIQIPTNLPAMKGKTFDQSHHDQENIAVHVRFNSRETEDGKSVLYLEEIQSDWHQKGKRFGYKTQLPEERSTQLSVLNNIVRRTQDDYYKLVDTLRKEHNLGSGPVADNIFEDVLPHAEKVEWKEARRLYHEAQYELNKYERQVIPGPFASSSAWPLLAFKRMVRWAAETGHDVVAWTPGTLQVARWAQSMRQKVDVIQLFPVPGEQVQVVGIKEGRNVFNEQWPVVGTKYVSGTPYTLEDLVGEKIANDFRGRMEIAEYRDKDLTIGGEGLKGYYDKIIPATVNKFFNKKTWGNAKATTIKLAMGDDYRLMYYGEELPAFIIDKRLRKKEKQMINELSETHDNLKLLEANAFAKIADSIINDVHSGRSLESAFQDVLDKFVKKDTFHEAMLHKAAIVLGGKIEMGHVPRMVENWALHITPEMRQKALTEGFPQYAVMPDWAKELYKKTKNPEVANLAREMPADEAGLWEKMGRWWKKRKDFGKDWRVDTTAMDRLLSLPSHYFQKIPALKSMFNDALERSDNYYHLLNNIERTNEGKSGIAVLSKLAKRDKGEYKRLKKYLIKMDRDAAGYKVVTQKTGFEALRPDKTSIGVFAKYEEAWDAARNDELIKAREAGFSDMAVDALSMFRAITDNGFKLHIKNLMEMNTRFIKAGKKPPQVVVWSEGERLTVDLQVALAKMGELRGHYFPRQRRPGRYTLYAKDPREQMNPVLEHFETKTMATLRKDELERQGYVVEEKRLRKMPEDVYQAAGQIAALNSLLNKSLEDTMKGLKPKAEHKKVMEEVELEFAKALAEQVADEIKARGIRQHMISRNDAVGKDVWIGYEEDPIQALAKYARGVAAGEAKKIMANRMMRHFTGTDISWQDFKATRIAELEADGVENPKVTYKDYLEFVKERRIDPIEQKNAYHDGQTFMMDMLRNDEAVDRFVGMVKGLAVMKYLAGRVSAPLINLTAMPTSVPAAAHGLAGISFGKALTMWPRAMKAWWKYNGWKGGGRKDLDLWDRKAFDTIVDKGWHKAQYNKEALAVLKTKVGQGWDTLIEYSMWGFGVTEMSNRIGTIWGTYKALREKNIKTFEQASDEEKLNMHWQWMLKGKEVSDKAHGVYGKANRPHFARGANAASRLAQAFYVFKTFAHNYLLTMKEVGYDQKDMKALAWMALAPAVLAGAGASPLLAVLFKAFQVAGADEPEEALYDWVEAASGQRLAALARLGVFGAAGYGVSLKGSLAIGITDIPTDIKSFFGAPGAIVDDLYVGTKNLMRGDTLKGLEKIFPNAIGSMFRSVREYSEGMTTNTNAPIYYGRERVKLSGVEALERFMSFNPARVAAIREEQWHERRLEQKYRDMQSDIYNRIAAYYLLDAKDRNPNEWATIMNMVREYNYAVSQMNVYLPRITSTSIRNNVRRKMRPSKRERLRKTG